VKDADIVITCGPIMHEPKPVIELSWLKTGVFVSTVDLDSFVKPEVFNAATLYTDDVDQFMGYSRTGSFVGIKEPIGNLGKLVVGTKPARESADEITMTSNLGLAVEDLAVGANIYRIAKERGLGQLLPL
jgi:ornithine cyclodeaminase/alanine dehydrogenase